MSTSGEINLDVIIYIIYYNITLHYVQFTIKHYLCTCYLCTCWHLLFVNISVLYLLEIAALLRLL